MKKLMLCILVSFLLLNVPGIQYCLAQDKYTVGLSVPGLDNPWFARCAKFTEYVGEALNVKVITVSCDYKEEKQLKDIEDLIARGVNGVIVLPQTSAIGPAILKACERAHVYIQGADRSLGLMPDEWQGRYYIGHIALDDEEGGYRNAKALLEAGCRKIVSINHARGASVSELRQKGLLRALKEYPDAELLATQWNVFTREAAVSTTESFLSAHPDLDGIYTIAAFISVGAMTAVERADKLVDIKIAGMDLVEESLKGIEEGKILFSSGSHWVSGGFGLIMLFDKLNGHEPLKRVTWIKPIGVTKDNVAMFSSRFLEHEPYTPDEIRSMSITFNPDAKLYEWVENIEQKME